MIEYRGTASPRPTPLGVFAIALAVLFMGPLVIVGGGEPGGLYIPAGLLVVTVGEHLYAALRLRGAGATIVGPPEVTSLEPFVVGIRATSPLPGMRVRILPMKDRVSLVGTETVEVVHPGVVHGLYPHAVVELEWTGPLGLASARRAIVVASEPPMASTPAAVHVPDTASLLADETAHGWRESPWHVRGLRRYQAGDPRQRVHWRASARHGELLVRDPQLTGEGEVHVVLAMHSDHDPVALGTCRGLLESLLARGYDVVVTTRRRGLRALSPLEFAGLIYSAYWPQRRPRQALPGGRNGEAAAWAAGEVLTARVRDGHDIVRRLAEAIGDADIPVEPGALVVDDTGVRRG